MENNFNKFLESIKIGNISEAKSNFDIEYFNVEDNYGLKPIHWACLTSNTEILNWMMEEKCNIETRSGNGWRPIHFAQFIKNEEMMMDLIEWSCKTDCKTDNGETIKDIENGYFNNEFMDEILNANINLKIGLSMGLICDNQCKHEFCLRSIIWPERNLDLKYRSEHAKKVIPVKDSKSKRNFAIKVIDSGDYGEYKNQKCIGPEINNILPNLNHLRIIKYYGLIKIQTEMIFLMEWMYEGSLKNRIEQKVTLNNTDICRYCKDILQAVAFLHDNKILHRFINPAKNIFIDKDGCKLAISYFSCSLADGDFQINDKLLKYSIPAPECVNNGILSYPYDIWLLGCTVIEMLTGKRPHYQRNNYDEFENIISKISNEMMKSFIRNMVMVIPAARATANELLNHEFIRKI